MIIADLRAVLFDIDGTITDGIGGPALPGAVRAVHKVAQNRPIRFVTNGTSWGRAALLDALRREGFPVDEERLVTPSRMAQRILTERDHAAGVLIAEPSVLPDMAWFTLTPPDSAKAVLLATEGHDLTIRDLGVAVEALLRGAKLYTLQQNRVFRRRGQLVTDLGPVAAFLGYAANVTWENLGKPAPLLFETLASDLGCRVHELAMVGDDAEFDASGSLRAGCGAGFLVRTGKYRFGDETGVSPAPSLVIDGVESLVDLFA